MYIDFGNHWEIDPSTITVVDHGNWILVCANPERDTRFSLKKDQVNWFVEKLTNATGDDVTVEILNGDVAISVHIARYLFVPLIEALNGDNNDN